uniref:DSBA-like thioredoxin domain-containing protein n=1 Tax=Sinocyclocheilus anshuiensis TaxID=1608454 RepID=A0A671QQ72_9TELE
MSHDSIFCPMKSAFFINFRAYNCLQKNLSHLHWKVKKSYIIKFLLFLGNRPPGMVPNKFNYMTTDLKRLSKYFGVHLSPPSNVFEAMFEKAVAEKKTEGDVLVEGVSRELWKRIWRTDQDITQPVSLTEAGLKAGLSPNEVEEILTLSNSQPIKDKLKISALCLRLCTLCLCYLNVIVVEM